MPSKHEMEAMQNRIARTDEERREDRRFDAAFVFETMPESEFNKRNLGAQFYS